MLNKVDYQFGGWGGEWINRGWEIVVNTVGIFVASDFSRTTVGNRREPKMEEYVVISIGYISFHTEGV